MIESLGPIQQACMGTVLTWALTAAGAAVVVFFKGTQQKLLDGSLGFAAGVMLAASYWSLLDPALEMAEESKLYGDNGEYSIAPVALGFFIGALFVYGADVIISAFGIHSPHLMVALAYPSKEKNSEEQRPHFSSKNSDKNGKSVWDYDENIEGLNDVFADSYILSRRKNIGNSHVEQESQIGVQSRDESFTQNSMKASQWKRILLLIIAVTIHNIPEGLAVGVGFGAIGNSPSATFDRARNLAVGIGIQNFPEGLAVSLPLKAAGFSTWRSFWYGQLSGMVEPIFGILGAATVRVAQPLLPYALAFAAGAMVYVVVDDILPEAHSSGNGKLASWGAVLGFIVMMALDVGLG